MSHFSVLVIGEDPEDQLEAFDENLEYPKYSKGEVEEEDVIQFIEYYCKEGSNNKDLSDEERKINNNLNLKELYEKYGEQWNNNHWKFVAESSETGWNNRPDYPYKAGTFEEFSTYNPNSKWDWYELGGRFSNRLLLKTGEYADEALAGEVDWDRMIALAAEKAAERWDSAANALGTTEGIINQPTLSWEDTLERSSDLDEAGKIYNAQPQVIAFKNLQLGYYSSISDFNYTREDYINLNKYNYISTFAVLMDGEWFERGNMGWFGMSSETEEEGNEWKLNFYDKFIKDLLADTNIAIYDLHI